MVEKNKKMIMPFGKYKGTLLDEVPHGYLLYLYDRKLLSGKIKKYAEENITVLKFNQKTKP